MMLGPEAQTYYTNGSSALGENVAATRCFDKLLLFLRLGGDFPQSLPRILPSTAYRT
jgi:hypothetical protein